VSLPLIRPPLVAHDLRKDYPMNGETVHALRGVSLQVDAGDYVAIAGPSGSGKSTLLQLLGGIDIPSGGDVEVLGTRLDTLSDRDLTRLRGHTIGFVFQYHHLIPAFTALENVIMPLLVDRGRRDAQMWKRGEELLASVGLTQWKDNLASNMSGGQQQRVAVARALAMKPSVLLADEPTGNLDTQAAQVVFDLLREVNRAHGTAVLLVTHNHALAEQCGRLIEIVDGRVTSDRRLH